MSVILEIIFPVGVIERMEKRSELFGGNCSYQTDIDHWSDDFGSNGQNSNANPRSSGRNVM